MPGTTPSWTASTVAMPSTAPAAPSMCPVIDLVAVTTGWSPIARRMVLDSAMSPTGVEVACALTCPMSAAVRPAVVSALAIARAEPSPSGSGAVMWYASLDIPMPASRP